MMQCKQCQDGPDDQQPVRIGFEDPVLSDTMAMMGNMVKTVSNGGSHVADPVNYFLPLLCESRVERIESHSSYLHERLRNEQRAKLSFSKD